jgi:hypothetical protein
MPYKVAVRNFPHPSLTTSSPVGRVAPVFILASLMFNVVLLIQTVVSERRIIIIIARRVTCFLKAQ